MESQVLHIEWCNISAKAAGEIWHGSLLGVKGLMGTDSGKSIGWSRLLSKLMGAVENGAVTAGK